MAVFSLAPDSSKDCFVSGLPLYGHSFLPLMVTEHCFTSRDCLSRFRGLQRTLASVSQERKSLPGLESVRLCYHFLATSDICFICESLLSRCVSSFIPGQQVCTRALCHPRVSSALVFLGVMIQNYGKELLNGSNLGLLLGFRAPYYLVQLLLTLKDLLIC